MTPPTIDIAALESIEALASADMLASLSPSDAAALGVAVTQIADAYILTVKNINRMLFNRVVGLGSQTPITPETLGEITRYLQTHAAPNHAIQLTPDAATPEVTAWLTDAGLPYTNSWIKLSRDASPVSVPATTLTVRRAHHSDADVFEAISRIAFPWFAEYAPLLIGSIGQEGNYHYLAYDGDTPVAIGGLYVRNGYGWLGSGGTLPTHRRRGAQSALIARRLQDGIAAGVHTFVTETADDTPDNPNPSTHNLRRAGFQIAYRRANYEQI